VRRHPTGTEPVDRMVTPDALRAAIPEVDVVVLAAPANATTHRLVDRGFLRAVKPGALLINVARGSLVDEDALLDALDSGVLAAAVLDVTDVEPLPPDHRLWSHPGVTITAHNAAGGTGRYARAADLFIENLGRYRSGDRLRHEVTAADFDPA
jgi:phosphoglycerate dehydrogenase-like enzyme